MPRAALLPVVLVLHALVAPRAARAQADCATLPSPLYVTGAPDLRPLLARVAPRMATAAAGQGQLTLIYQGALSCAAIAAVLANTALTGTASYWTVENGAARELACTLADRTSADLALSEVAARTCTGQDLPPGFAQLPSLVLGYGLVAPRGSTQQAITADEAYFLLKYGGEPGRQVPPWIDPALVVVRGPGDGTQLQVGLAAAVPGAAWSARLTNANPTSAAVVAKVAAEDATGNADKTLGVLPLSVADASRDRLKLLAFQSYQQGCLGGAVFPDSTGAALDKRNLRDGHYTIWSYLWSVTPADGAAPGRPKSAAARALVDFLAGTAPIHGANPVDDAARAGLVPACAMQVRRAGDGAPLERFRPAEPCGCRFEALVAGGSTCRACTTNADCPDATRCRFGFCEKE